MYIPFISTRRPTERVHSKSKATALTARTSDLSAYIKFVNSSGLTRSLERRKGGGGRGRGSPSTFYQLPMRQYASESLRIPLSLRI